MLRAEPRLRVLRGDDSIGIAQTCYPGKHWEKLRRFHTYFAGWSAGWYLAEGRGMMPEGHFRDSEEIDRIPQALEDTCPRCDSPEVVRLEGDTGEFARRMATHPPSIARGDRGGSRAQLPSVAGGRRR